MAASGTYISQSDVENVFGTENVARWSNLDNSSTDADETRIQAAIDYAEARVDDRFRPSRYRVPLVGDGATLRAVIDWVAKLAGIWLYESRGLHDAGDTAHKLTAVKANVETEIDMYLAGQRKLPAQLKRTDAPTAPKVVE